MNENVPSDAEQNLDAPPKLVAALKHAARREMFVPPSVDRAILAAARAQLEPIQKPSSSARRRWLLWPAFVTACIAGVLIVRLTATHEQTQFSREDLNHDGKVDILDSFAVAREIKNGQRAPKAFDVNGDGVVDELDVNQIAAHAVSLGKESRS
jgi:hypothetical protein